MSGVYRNCSVRATLLKMGKVHSVLETLIWRGHWADPDGNKILRDTASTFKFVDKVI